MEKVKAISYELTDMITEINNHREFITKLHSVMGMDTESLDCSILMNKIIAMNGNHIEMVVDVDTQKVIDLTISAVEKQLDDVYCYFDEPYLDVQDYTDEVSINLCNKDEIFRLDTDEVYECVKEELNPKEEEPKEEKQETEVLEDRIAKENEDNTDE